MLVYVEIVDIYFFLNFIFSFKARTKLIPAIHMQIKFLLNQTVLCLPNWQTCRFPRIENMGSEWKVQKIPGLVYGSCTLYRCTDENE